MTILEHEPAVKVIKGVVDETQKFAEKLSKGANKLGTDVSEGMVEPARLAENRFDYTISSRLLSLRRQAEKDGNFDGGATQLRIISACSLQELLRLSTESKYSNVEERLRMAGRRVFHLGVRDSQFLTGFEIDPAWKADVSLRILKGVVDLADIDAFKYHPPLSPAE